MPTIRLHAVAKERLLAVAPALCRDLAVAFATEPDNVALEIVTSDFIREGRLDAEPYPMAEIIAFERGREVEAAVARVLTEALRGAGYPYCEVYYLYPQPRSYFCDGVSCE